MRPPSDASWGARPGVPSPPTPPPGNTADQLQRGCRAFVHFLHKKKGEKGKKKKLCHKLSRRTSLPTLPPNLSSPSSFPFLGLCTKAIGAVAQESFPAPCPLRGAMEGPPPPSPAGLGLLGPECSEEQNRVGLGEGAQECQCQMMGVPGQGWKWDAPHSCLSLGPFSQAQQGCSEEAASLSSALPCP